MINRPKNWDNVQAFSDRQKLPVGAYVCKIKKASVQETDFGFQLALAFDITEGEYAGYYAEEFKNNPANTKKWKGVLRQFLPKDDGSEKDEWTKSSLKGLITAIENSNLGYSWNWDENTLAGKEIGIIFRNEEWDYNGKHGWTARPFRATAAANVREGNCTIPEDKPLKKESTTAYGYGAGSYGTAAPAISGGFTEMEDDDGELPF